MYIYHNKTIDEYFAFNNLARLSDGTGINYENLKYWFVKEKKMRVEDVEWVIVKTELVLRKGAKNKNKNAK